MQRLTWNKLNKRVLLAGGLIVLGIFGMIGTASANYRYDHNPEDNYKFQNSTKLYSNHFRYGHPYYRDQHIQPLGI